MPPDLVVLLCDTARADAFRPWDGPQPTPTMERLCREGVRYSTAVAAAPWTLPSITSIFSGRLPSEHGVTNECVEWVDGNPTSPGRSIRGVPGSWLPDDLRARGYRTWAASCNIWISTWGGYDRGFDRFIDLQDNVRLPQGKWGRFARRGMRVLGVADRGGRPAAREFRRALDDPDPAPLFAFVNLMEVHTPLNPPRPFYPYRPWRRASTLRLSGASKGDRPFLVYTLGVAEPPPDYTTTMRTLYYSSARYEDALLGSFVEAIEERGRPTVLVVVSDHGENLGERGLFGHHSSLSEELLHVPLVVWGHKVDVGQGQVDDPVSLLGLSGWLTGLADGDGAPPGPQDTVVSEYESSTHLITAAMRERIRQPGSHSPGLALHAGVAIRRGGLKYVALDDGTEALYDLGSEAGEDRDILSAHPDAAAAFAPLKAAWAKRRAVQPTYGTGEPADQEITDHLRDLGYIE